nr:Gfo/Idh/MocA family oxidoreductase [Aequitasia blattaphilus]
MAAKAKVDAGELGKPFLFKSTSNDPLATIDGFLGYAPHSGGPWLDMAVHDIDLALWFLGGEVESVYAIGGGYLYPELEKIGCADNACALLKFKDGAMAQMHVGYSSPHGYQVETEIFGEGENIRISAVPAKNRLQTYNREGVLVECDESWPYRFNEAFFNEKVAFLNCIINDTIPIAGAKDGTATTKVALAATKAFETGEVVHI